MATSPLPSREPKSGRYCYVTRASSTIPTKGDKVRSGSIRHAFSSAQKWRALLCNLYVIWDPNKMGYNQKWQNHPFVLMRPIMGGIAT